MILLAIETSASACSLALKHHDTYLNVHEITPRQQTRLLLPMIKSLLERANLTAADLDAVAFGAGPGSFTGIRIAHSVATGLAFAADIPVIPVSSLEALALTAANTHQDWQQFIIAIDARMGDLYTASFQRDDKGGLQLIDQARVAKPSELILPNHNGEWYGIGDAFTAYPDLLRPQLTAIDATILTTASSVLALAEKMYQTGDVVAANLAKPIYLR